MNFLEVDHSVKIINAIIIFRCCCHVGYLLLAGGMLIVLVIVYCCCHAGYLLPAGKVLIVLVVVVAMWGKNGGKKPQGKNKNKTRNTKKHASPSEKPMLM